MNFEVDMSSSGYVEGINLWRVVGAEMKTAQTSGAKMLAIKLRTGQDELSFNVMLSGNGWKMFGRRMLIGLGLPAEGKVNLDPQQFIGQMLWVATVVKPNTYTDKNGEQKTTDRLEVDVSQLKYAGLQPANDPPPGFTAPPADVDDTPF